MFGLPIVLNPVLIIPFVIAPVITVIVGYFLTATGSIRGGIAQLICVIISVLIYAPFIKIYEKQ